MTISEGLVQDKLKKSHEIISMNAAEVEKSAMSIIPEKGYKLDPLIRDVLVQCFLKTGGDVQKLADLIQDLVAYTYFLDCEVNAIKREILGKR